MKMLSQFFFYVLVISTMACQKNPKILDAKNSKNAAVVTHVVVTGGEGSYTFSVTLESPDTGCNQYADWWEVISADGTTLIYRRILAHSHVSEQPFIRSGGVVAIAANQEVIVRGHMNPMGYGAGVNTMKGTVVGGFQTFEVAADFAATLEKAAPQPSGCAF